MVKLMRKPLEERSPPNALPLSQREEEKKREREKMKLFF
jgi:hypothetical protein